MLHETTASLQFSPFQASTIFQDFVEWLKLGVTACQQHLVHSSLDLLKSFMTAQAKSNMSACNKMKTEFLVTLRIAPNKCCDPLMVCDNTRVWSNTNLRSFKLSCLVGKFVLAI